MLIGNWSTSNLLNDLEYVFTFIERGTHDQIIWKASCIVIHLMQGQHFDPLSPKQTQILKRRTIMIDVFTVPDVL